MSDEVQAFGTWDAPLTDDAEWIEVPLGLTCMHCRDHFVDGDNGCIYPTGWAAHRECSLRSVLGGIGHLVDHAFYCGALRDPDAGLDYRHSAWLVWQVHTEGRTMPTQAELEEIRRLESEVGS